jgi:hypothetical protein
MSGEANVKRVELVCERSILFDWKECGSTSKNKVCIAWGSIGKALNK